MPLVGLRSDEDGLARDEQKDTEERLKDIFDFQVFGQYRRLSYEDCLENQRNQRKRDSNRYMFANVVGSVMQSVKDDEYVTRQVYLRDLTNILNNTITAFKVNDNTMSWKQIWFSRN